jgi:hypothetical protein
MTERIMCSSCELPLPTEVETSALAKLRVFNRARWEQLKWKRCSCIPEKYKDSPMFGGHRQPFNLDTYDRIDR